MDSFMKLPLIIFFGCSLLLQENLAEVLCENLPANLCSFAIASTGKRCVLAGTQLEYTCRATEVVPERLRGPYIESDKCVSACGVNRGRTYIECVGGCGVNNHGGFMVDGREPNDQFIQRLCSPACYRDCPNIIDFYDNILAAGKEGVNSTALCETHKSNVLEIAAFGPVLSVLPGSPISAPPFI